MEKRAQFYLIAALVIIGIITGLTTVYTSSKISSEDRVVYDLSAEINFEASQVIDSGTLNCEHSEDDAQDCNAQMRENIENLVSLYASDPASREELIVVFGDRDSVIIITYVLSETGSICISLGGTPICLDQQEEQHDSEEYQPGDTGIVNVTIGNDLTYGFELQQGQNFFMIIRKQNQDETFVASSQPGGGNVNLAPNVDLCTPNGGLIEMCHVPVRSGNPITLFIGPDSLQIHLDHGDYCGPCT